MDSIAEAATPAAALVGAKAVVRTVTTLTESFDLTVAIALPRTSKRSELGVR
jgi:hypothetical protein